MRLTPRITIRDLPPSEALEDHIKQRLDKLNSFYDRIMHCDVVVEQAQKHKHNGKLYNARISLTVPGEELVVNHATNEDVYVAIRDSFNAARRRLQTYARRKRGEVKNHELPLHGRIIKLFHDESFGFIACNDDEYYFSETNLNHANFDDLAVGTPVRFLANVGGEGLQANRVIVQRD